MIISIYWRFRRRLRLAQKKNWRRCCRRRRKNSFQSRSVISTRSSFRCHFRLFSHNRCSPIIDQKRQPLLPSSVVHFIQHFCVSFHKLRNFNEIENQFQPGCVFKIFVNFILLFSSCFCYTWINLIDLSKSINRHAIVLTIRSKNHFISWRRFSLHIRSLCVDCQNTKPHAVLVMTNSDLHTITAKKIIIITTHTRIHSFRHK